MIDSRFLICVLTLLLSYTSLTAQVARSSALAETSVTLQDESSGMNNIAGTASITSPSAHAGFDTKFGSSAFNSISLALVAPLKVGAASFDLKRFGTNLYNESAIGLGFSHKIQMVSVGLKASYLQYYIEEYGTRGMFTFEFGGIAEIIPKLSIGASIHNFNKPRISTEISERLSARMNLGIGYRIINHLLLLTEIEKEENSDSRYKAGIEYRIIKNVLLRTGIASHPIRNTFGFGIILKSFKIDYAIGSYSRVGYQNTFSLTYCLKK